MLFAKNKTFYNLIKMKICNIQTPGTGNIIIAMPAAMYYINSGCIICLSFLTASLAILFLFYLSIYIKISIACSLFIF